MRAEFWSVALVAALPAALLASGVHADPPGRQSRNFVLTNDSFTAGGGVTAGNGLSLFSALGEGPDGFMDSRNFMIESGFVVGLPGPAILSIDAADVALIDRRRAGRTELDYIFIARVANNGETGARNIVAELIGAAPEITIIDGRLSFEDVAPGDRVTSIDTVTLRVSSRVRIDPASLVWSVGVVPE